MQDSKWFNPNKASKFNSYLGVSTRYPTVHEVFLNSDNVWVFHTLSGEVRDTPVLIRNMPEGPLGWDSGEY